MAKDDIKEHEFKKGQSGNPNGRPKGSKNRSTIAKEVLQMKAIFPTAIFEALQKQYPEIEKTTSVEEIMTIVMANKAITKADVNAYKALMDSGYGAPVQQVEQTIIEQPLFPDVSENDSNE